MKIENMLGRNGWLVWLFLLQGMLTGLGRGQTANEIKSPSDAGRVPPPESKLSLDDLRALLHLYSRVGRPTMVEEMAGKILKQDSRDQETLRMLASYYLERKDAPRSLKYARALVKFYPNDAEARFLLAMGYRLDGQSRLAKEVLADLRLKKFENRLFPYETELASAALATGDWPQAIRSYREALKNPKLQPGEMIEARRQLEELYRLHSPQVVLKETATLFKSGLIFRSALDWTQPLAINHSLRLELDRDDLKLKRMEGLRAQWANRYDVLAAIESDYRPWRTRVFVGLGDEGAIYGGNLTRVLGEDQYLTLSLHANQRATDSLLLEVLHGREDEVVLWWHSRFYPDITANVKLRARRILVDGETLGYGYSVDLNLERAILKNVPELRAGYRGLVSSYSQSSKNIQLLAGVVAPGTSASNQLVLLNNLVSDINLHGIYLSWQQAINPEWSWQALIGGDYSFTRSTFGQSAEAGVSYFPSRKTEFIFNAGYSTSASTSEQDTERLELSLAFRWRF
jgi:hypothetical protein